MQKLEECLKHIREDHLTESEAISNLVKIGFRPYEAYRVCMNELTNVLDKQKLRITMLHIMAHDTPLAGYYNEYGATVLPKEELD